MNNLKGNDLSTRTTHIAKTPPVPDFKLTLSLLCSLGTHTHTQIFSHNKKKVTRQLLGELVIVCSSGLRILNSQFFGEVFLNLGV